MLRVMQAAVVMQRHDTAVGIYAEFMRKDLFADVLHESYEGVYRYSSIWCGVLVIGPVPRFLGMFDSGE
jgi:uncharacterized membrane protein